MPELKVKLRADSSKLESGLDRAKKKVKDFAKGFAPVAALGAAFGVVATAVVNLGSRITDLATQTRTGVVAFQVLEAAAIKAGARTEDLARGLRNIQKRGVEAEQGAKGYADAFARLGINLAEFNNLRPEKQLEAIARAAKEAQKNGLDPLASISRIIGEESGPRLQEVLDRLANEGFEGLKQSAIESGQVMDEETAEGLDSIADSAVFAKNAILKGIAPAMLSLLKTLQSFGKTRAFNIFWKAALVIFSTVIAMANKLINGMNLVIAVFSVWGKIVLATADAAITALTPLLDFVSRISEAISKLMDGDFGGFKDAIGEGFDDLKNDLVESAKKAGEEFRKANKETKKTFQEDFDKIAKRNEEIQNEAEKQILDTLNLRDPEPEKAEDEKKNKEEASQSQDKSEEANDRLDELKKQRELLTKEIDKDRRAKVTVGQLRGVGGGGGFFSGNEQAVINVQKDQLSQLKKIESAIKELELNNSVFK